MRIPIAVVLTLACAASHADDTFDSVGVSVANMANPFFVRLAKGAEDGAKAINPGASVTVLGGAYDLVKQSGHIDDFIARKVDVIVIAAVDSEAIGPAVARAKAAGIVVIAADVTAKNADAAVTTDNVEAGRLACAHLAERLGGSGNVIVLNGPPVSSVRDRVKGCNEVLAKHPGLKLLTDSQDAKGSIEGGQKTMTDLLTAHAKVDAVFAINDPTAIGAELAARQAGRTALFFTAVDGAPMAEKALKAPNGLLSATASQDPYALGRTAVELGAKRARGETVEPLTLVAPKLVTRETVGAYRGWESN